MKSRGRHKSSQRERGQVIGFFVVAMVVLIAMAAFAIDVGSWYRADRQAQTVADAAALAGAQALPGDVATAQALADQYANLNGGTGAVKVVTFSSSVQPNDTITVEITDQTPGVFTKLFGRSVVDVHARATARVGHIAAARSVAPMVVSEDHPMLACGVSCFYEATTIQLDNDTGVLAAPGAFDLINLDGSEAGSGKNPGTSTLANWIEYGYDDYLPLGLYYQRTGSSFTSSQVQNAMNDRIGTTLLFPVVGTTGEGDDETPPLDGNGSNAQYNVVAWAAFYLTDWSAQGNEAKISGYFETVIWEGIQGTTSGPDYGVRDIQLIE